MRIVLLLLLILALPCHAADKPEVQAAGLMQAWATIQYHMPAKVRPQKFLDLLQRVRTLALHYPQAPEPMVWQAIALASYAQAENSRKGLKAIAQARDLLLAAEQINPKALNGAIYITLGRLYAKAPGWPISFGSRGKARACLEKALAINPESLEANYFYGDLLASGGDYAKAIEYYQKALGAPPRPGMEAADAGRRQEVEAALARARHRQDSLGLFSAMSAP
ncbi:MAG TPA: tetratricopeptide repeat protein [Methylophilaceae bacterium]|nr:tetratricopeptide repeat protein [Methylophilaceae bacterium]